MTLSIFLRIMYKCLGQSSSITAFVIDLFEAILGEDVKNPLEEYERSTIYKIYNGKLNLSKKKAAHISDNFDLDNFYDYLSYFSLSKVDLIADELRSYNIHIDENDTYEDIAKVFTSIISTIAGTSSDEPKINIISMLSKNSIYKDNAIYSNDIKISFDLSLKPQSIQQVSFLLNKTYSRFTKRQLTTFDDFKLLPKKYSVKYSSHYDFVLSALKIKSNIVKLFIDGAKEFQIMENLIIDYVDKSNDKYKNLESKGFFSLLDDVSKLDYSNSRLLRIKNLITKEIIIGLFYILLNDNKVHIDFLFKKSTVCETNDFKTA